MNPSADLICKDLSLGRPQPVLQNVSLHLRPGHLHALCGPNGAGKSTLLHSLAGELVPDGGQVLIGQRPVRNMTLIERARRRAVLAQNPALDHPFTCRQVIGLGSAGPQSSDLADSLLRELGCLQLADRIYTRLSGGEQRLIQLTRVLAQAEAGARMGHQPWLLLDEPTSQLDLGRVERVLTALQQRARKGWGVLLALHDLELASRCAHQLLLLAAGRLLAAGPPPEVLTASHLRAGWGVEAVVSPAPVGPGVQIRVTSPG